MKVPLSINVQTAFLVVRFPHRKEGFVWSSHQGQQESLKKKKQPELGGPVWKHTFN